MVTYPTKHEPKSGLKIFKDCSFQVQSEGITKTNIKALKVKRDKNNINNKPIEEIKKFNRNNHYLRSCDAYRKRTLVLMFMNFAEITCTFTFY